MRSDVSIESEHNQGGTWTGDISILTADLGLDALRTGDLAQVLPGPSAAVEETADLLLTADLDGAKKRSFKRYDLSHRTVRANIWHKRTGAPALGRVLNASVNGAWIETDAPLSMRTPIVVQLPAEGRTQTFEGRVIRSVKGGMAIYLSTDDATWSYRRKFIQAARDVKRPEPRISIEVRSEAQALRNGADFEFLSALWATVPANLDSDRVHQDFIQECCRRRQTEFALERYSELKAEYPDDARIERCIEQIGHILSFCWVGDKPREDNGIRRKVHTVVGLGVVAGAILLLGYVFIEGMLSSERLLDPKPSPSPARLKEDKAYRTREQAPAYVPPPAGAHDLEEKH